jgi:CBS domain-containing protein
LYPDSIYTAVLRLRGIRVGPADGANFLHRLTVEQVTLDPVSVIQVDTPLEKIIELTSQTGVMDFVVFNKANEYVGMVTAEDLRTALLEREAIPLLVAGEIVRKDLPAVRSTDDLAQVLEAFSLHEVARLPVALPSDANRVIGLISRRGLMQRYTQALGGTR